MNKTSEQVRGSRIRCLDYEMCPLCYGCRAFNSRYQKCLDCKNENAKFNLCDTKKHKTDLIAKMITRERIDLDK